MIAINLEFFRKLLVGTNIQLAILFGSLSRGDHRSDSDLDLAVAGDAPLDNQEKEQLIENLALAFGRPVDLVDLRSVGLHILSEVITKGEVIYCIDRTLYAELIKRMLFDNADFAPYRNRILEERRKAWIGV